MVLNSQAPQTTLRRQYMTRRSRAPRWPWALAAIGVVGVIVWLLMSDAEPTPRQADAAAPPSSAAPAPSAPTRTPAASAPVAPPQPPPPANPAPAIAEFAPTRARLNATTSAPTPAPASTPASVPVPSGASTSAYAQGMAMIADGKYVEGRALLSRLIFDPQSPLQPADAATVRDTLASINKDLVFGKTINEDDPLIDRYVIQSGDYLVRIAPRYHLTPECIQRINGVDPGRLMVGQKLKVVRGPFHARVVKRDFRLDLYLKDDLGNPVYVSSLPVGLGEGGSTPVGNWIIKPASKAKNPAWTNPRTGQHYAPDDPANPIGEYWLALQGADPTTESITGYGIHGTTDPDSIGSQRSMGCVRLRDADIELLFNLLIGGESTVQIVP